MSILEVKNIQKSFGKVSVLNDISFTLEAGQAISIIGSSGSGKTTLLRCLNFLETPDKGSISVRDKILFDAGQTAAFAENAVFGPFLCASRTVWQLNRHFLSVLNDFSGKVLHMQAFCAIMALFGHAGAPTTSFDIGVLQ